MSARLLIVDDSPTQLEALRSLLVDADCYIPNPAHKDKHCPNCGSQYQATDQISPHIFTKMFAQQEAKTR